MYDGTKGSNRGKPKSHKAGTQTPPEIRNKKNARARDEFLHYYTIGSSELKRNYEKR